MNSTIFYLTEELYGMRMGGGGAALEILAGEYQNFPVFDIFSVEVDNNLVSLLDRKAMKYHEEIENQERRKLDLFILKSIGFDNPEKMLVKLYDAFLDAVKDRLVKAYRPGEGGEEISLESEEEDE